MLVADRFEAGRRPVLNLSATSFEPDIVMEFGFNYQQGHVTVTLCSRKVTERAG